MPQPFYFESFFSNQRVKLPHGIEGYRHTGYQSSGCSIARHRRLYLAMAGHFCCAVILGVIQTERDNVGHLLAPQPPP